MNRVDAEKIVDVLLHRRGLASHFTRYEVCGSIRRKKPVVGDIDIVAIPKPFERYQFGETSLDDFIPILDPDGPKEAKKLGKSCSSRYLNGDAIKRFNYKGANIDLYLATPETFECLKLIRTGSAEHNVRITKIAKSKGLKLFASGKGLCRIDSDGNIIETIETTEDGILKYLLGRVPKPEDRRV